jgi:hypothetical protein
VETVLAGQDHPVAAQDQLEADFAAAVALRSLTVFEFFRCEDQQQRGADFC